jgi:hypothetical protein
LDKKDIRNEAWLTTLENGQQGQEMKNCSSKWALRNGFCKDDESDVFIEAAENRHKNTGNSR